MEINELKSTLSRFNIRPNKLLGQNFLLSEEVLDKIITAAELAKTDTVLEIGPGLGVLTRKLADSAGQVIAVEKDRKLAGALRKMFKNRGNVKIIPGDALSFDPADFQLSAHAYKLVANIPYYLTGKIIQNFLTAREKPSLMVMLLQKEVGERITAKPGDMSILSISAQLYSVPEIISYVGKENFYPAPEVDSAVVRLALRKSPLLQVEEKRFFQLVKLGFANKRKQLHNNLTSGLGRGEYKEILEAFGLNPLARAEDLSLQDWEKLYKKIFSESIG